MEKEMEKEKNILMILEVNLYLKLNIQMVKGMEKGKHMIIKVIQYLKQNIKMIKELEIINIMLMVN